MKKIYILTCINEASELVSAKAYKNLIFARADMVCKAMDESAEFESLGRPGNYCDIGEMSSACGDEEACYVWNITEDEI